MKYSVDNLLKMKIYEGWPYFNKTIDVRIIANVITVSWSPASIIRAEIISPWNQ